MYSLKPFKANSTELIVTYSAYIIFSIKFGYVKNGFSCNLNKKKIDSWFLTPRFEKSSKVSSNVKL